MYRDIVTYEFSSITAIAPNKLASSLPPYTAIVIYVIGTIISPASAANRRINTYGTPVGPYSNPIVLKSNTPSYPPSLPTAANDIFASGGYILHPDRNGCISLSRFRWTYIHEAYVLHRPRPVQILDFLSQPPIVLPGSLGWVIHTLDFHHLPVAFYI
ncbi:hypothetical protein AX774_g5798 [Zancudomyces culisetae]|uniref:Uncharacterized protein n=1 Tax=Zancudomyces culisetae TaxID=1213189 RepID=A0A1R1PIE4_ZANCU|nr:hypothetical protein AX774_g5798 [Zancudomyces culisetae]|eukprot:OMH80754.1 hypothetical protein AX774_g5798 [Zancudomyces culisetae]